MADLSDLAQKIAFYQAGGRDPGTDPLDKLNSGIGIVDSTIKDVLAIKKAKVENAKTSAETQKTQQEGRRAGYYEGIPSIQEEAAQKSGILGRNSTRVPENIYPQPTADQESPGETGVGPHLPRPSQVVPQPEQFNSKREDFTKRTGMNPDLSIPMNVQQSLIPLRTAQTGLANSKIGGESINVDDMISKATGIPVGKITKVQYDATLNALKLQAKTDPNRPLRPFEALILGVPFGTTAGQAEGVIPRSQSDKEKITQFNGAIAVVDQVDKLSQKVNVFETAFDRFTSGGLTAVEAYIQSDPVATQLANQGAYLAQIIRGLGEKGTLAEGDVKRGLDAIPKVYPIPDTRVVAENKIAELKSLFSGISSAYLQTLTTPIRQPGTAQAATAPSDIEAKKAALRAKLKI